MRVPSLGCTEFAVPGRTLEEKLGLLESRRMWLELVNDGDRRLEPILTTVSNFNIPILSVQANRLHSLRLLSDDLGERRAATRHVEETMEWAAALGAENVVTTLVFGDPAAKDPYRLALEIFRDFGWQAEELGITVSVEPLGRNRTSFLPRVSEVHSFVSELGQEHVRLMADTMHIHDSGDDVREVVIEYLDEISELQLRDTDSRPPGMGRLDFSGVMEAVARKFKGLLCLEYKPGANPKAEFDFTCGFVLRLIAAAR
ncbi:MAG: sugar phosphate isomerase/epimerase family protein [Candidatus Hadarchaeum sp.]|uniref:sugar phosphate isomerase/epimerase family protein n=1 Tax=Candidatus Hadarchaeum sp. TaxID=2883567 RepID=UPI003D0B21DC